MLACSTCVQYYVAQRWDSAPSTRDDGAVHVAICPHIWDKHPSHDTLPFACPKCVDPDSD